MKNIILASSSPRRMDIMNELKIPFKVRISDVNESEYTNYNPVELVKILAEKKAQNVIKPQDKNAIVIGADTVVSYNSSIIGKPANYDLAFEYLKLLSGKTHSVYTGIAIIDTKTNISYIDYCETKVTMREYSDAEIISYINTKEPFGKAGAYAIQGIGAVFVKQIHGDYSNVVGLPISKLIEGFKVLNIDYFNSFHN